MLGRRLRNLKPADKRRAKGGVFRDILRQKSKDYAEANGRYSARAVVVDEAEARLSVSEAEHPTAVGVGKICEKRGEAFPGFEEASGQYVRESR